MSYLNKIFFLIGDKFKTKFYFVIFLSLIGMVFEIFGIGMIIPVLGFMLTPITELLNEYPFLDPFLAFLDYPDQTTLIIYGISLLIAIYVIKTIFFILK